MTSGSTFYPTIDTGGVGTGPIRVIQERERLPDYKRQVAIKLHESLPSFLPHVCYYYNFILSGITKYNFKCCVYICAYSLILCCTKVIEIRSFQIGNVADKIAALITLDLVSLLNVLLTNVKKLSDPCNMYTINHSHECTVHEHSNNTKCKGIFITVTWVKCKCMIFSLFQSLALEKSVFSLCEQQSTSWALPNLGEDGLCWYALRFESGLFVTEQVWPFIVIF